MALTSYGRLKLRHQNGQKGSKYHTLMLFSLANGSKLQSDWVSHRLLHQKNALISIAEIRCTQGFISTCNSPEGITKLSTFSIAPKVTYRVPTSSGIYKNRRAILCTWELQLNLLGYNPHPRPWLAKLVWVQAKNM